MHPLDDEFYSHLVVELCSSGVSLSPNASDGGEVPLRYPVVGGQPHLKIKKVTTPRDAEEELPLTLSVSLSPNLISPRSNLSGAKNHTLYTASCQSC